jgi:hypothetical protein
MVTEASNKRQEVERLFDKAKGIKTRITLLEKNLQGMPKTDPQWRQLNDDMGWAQVDLMDTKKAALTPVLEGVRELIKHIINLNKGTVDVDKIVIDSDGNVFIPTSDPAQVVAELGEKVPATIAADNQSVTIDPTHSAFNSVPFPTKLIEVATDERVKDRDIRRKSTDEAGGHRRHIYQVELTDKLYPGSRAAAITASAGRTVQEPGDFWSTGGTKTGGGTGTPGGGRG